MKQALNYLLPAACFLLLTVFFLLLPPLRFSKLSDPEPRRRLDRFDALIMALVTLVYSAVAFTNLGDRRAPQTFVNMEGKSADLSLYVENRTASKLMLYTGAGIGGYEILYTTDGNDLYQLANFTQSHAEVFKWEEVNLSYYVTGGVITLHARGNVWLGEVAALDDEGKIVPVHVEYPELTDEEELVPQEQTYLNSAYFDEIYHARTAWEQLHRIPAYEITHPPLGKSILGLGIRLFGMTPFGWRFSGTLLGALMLPLLYIFAKKLFGGYSVPSACTVLMATDFMHFVQTRIATIDVYAVFFILLMYLFMYLFVSEGKWRWLALSGLAFGFGAACKWTCLYAGAGLGVIWLLWVLRGFRNKTLTGKGFLKNCGFCVVFFVLVPLLIYDLAYLPYGLAAGIQNPFSPAYLRIVLDNQKYMFSYHAGLVSTHPYSSTWYQWLLDIRPILYYLAYYPDGTHSAFGAFVNPALCWGGLLSLFVLAYLSFARKDEGSRFLLVGYLAQLLPWVLVTRLTFAYHYFPCTVFLALSLGRCFSLLRLNDRWGRVYIAGFAALSLALFLLFFPCLTGLPYVSGPLRSWLPTWPF